MADDAPRSGDGLDVRRGLPNDHAFAYLNELGDHQVITAAVLESVILAPVGLIDAGVGIARHITVGFQLGALGIHLIFAADFHHILGKIFLADGVVCTPGFIAISLFGSFSVPIFCNVTVTVLHSIIYNGAGQFVVSTLGREGILVIAAAVVLVMAAALFAILGVESDCVLQTNRCVVFVFDKVIGLIVPFQLQAFADQHTIGGFNIVLLIGQKLKLRVGGEVKMLDVVGVVVGDDVFGLRINGLTGRRIPVIVFFRPFIIGEFLNRTVRLDVISALFIRAGVVVPERFLIGTAMRIGFAFVDLDIGFLGFGGLSLQSFDELVLAHVLKRNCLSKIVYEVFVQCGRCGDLGVADPEFFALILVKRRENLGLDVIKQFFAGFLEVLFVVFVLFDGRDCAGGVVLFRHHVQLFAQPAVVDRNGLAVLCVGSGLAVSAQLDLLCGDAREVACQLIDQQCFDLRRGQGKIAVLFGEGIGSFFVVRIDDVTGVRTIFVLLYIFIDIITNRDGTSLFVDGPLLIAVNIDNVADRLLGFAGCRLLLGSNPADFSGAAGEGRVGNLIAVCFQFRTGLAGFLFQLLPSEPLRKLILLRLAERNVFLGDHIGGDGLAVRRSDLIGRYGLVALFLGIGHLSPFRRCPRIAGACGIRIAVVLTVARPRDRTGSDLSRAGNGVLFGVDRARCVGSGSGGLGSGGVYGVVQGIGLTVESVGEGVGVVVELAVLQCLLCLSVIKLQLFQSLLHRIVAGFGLCSGFGLFDGFGLGLAVNIR